MIANQRLALFKTFIKDKKSFQEFNEETKKFSFYFRRLQKDFDVRGKQDILEQPEDSGRYQDNFYHGLVRSNEEKGVADILLLRARRRKELFSDESKKI